MANVNYTELFYSTQGEGRFMGVPSIFLRMFGCNFRCKNFGRLEQDILSDQEVHNPEVAVIIKNLDQYKTFKDLPLVATGCDSYSSVYPEFKRFVIKETTDELTTNIINLLPHRRWEDEHLVITGGEPLLGWQRAYPDLLSNEDMSWLKELTFETNGTQPLSADFQQYLLNWTLNSKYSNRGSARGRDALTFSVSPKLSVSGEKWSDAICPEIVKSYEFVGHTYLKFVVATESDANEALKAIDEYRQAGFQGPVYLMPVGGTSDTYFMNAKHVAELALEHGLRYSARLHVDLWKNAWGT